LQAYINKYPKSSRSADANSLIDQSRKKLELKQADAANLYFNIEKYKAATVAYKSVLRAYPESPNDDLYQFMIIKSMYRYAKASIPQKQEERYDNAISAYHEFKDVYPNSKYAPDADKLYADVDYRVKKIRDEQHK
jgi:outer membrane protein assembly factor BamD